MGAYNSKYVLEDFKSNKNQSEEYNLHAWENTKPKNFDYYFNRPTTKISRKYYPEYERGLIYGYTNKVYYTNYIDEED
jgi:hypothetical protein